MKPKPKPRSVIPKTVAVDFIFEISVHLRRINRRLTQLEHCWARVESRLDDASKPKPGKPRK